jgi:hypothetical protein
VGYSSLFWKVSITLPCFASSAPDAAESDGGEADVKIDESEKGASGKSGGGSRFASFLHVELCIAGFLFVIPSGALVGQYAKATGSSTAFDLHQTLQFHVGAYTPLVLYIHRRPTFF